MTKKRIIFVSTNLAGGGAERVLALLLHHINLEKYEPYLVVFEEVFHYKIPEYIPVIQLGKRGWYDFPKLVYRLYNTTSSLKPDVVISFLTYTNIIAVLAKLSSKLKYKLIISQHDVPSIIERTDHSIARLVFCKWLPILLYPKADAVICVSHGVATDVLGYYKVPMNKIKVIHNPIDIDAIKKMSAESICHPWFSEDIPIIISAGRLHPIKGFPFLLEAFDSVCKQHHCRLVILGEGPDENSLKELAHRMRIDESVLFLGFQENPFKYISRANIFVFSSLAGEFGNVVKEAAERGEKTAFIKMAAWINRIRKIET